LQASGGTYFEQRKSKCDRHEPQPQQFTKQAILSRVDEIQGLDGSDRLHAMLTLRDRYPAMWDQLGEIYQAEGRERSQAA